MLKRTKTLYKGDMIAASLYIFIGMIFIVISTGLYYFTSRIGLYYLSFSLLLFSFYMLGKGLFMIYLYLSRYRYFQNKKEMILSDVIREIEYTLYRISKKQKNRRYYIYAMIIGSSIAFMGIFHQEKGVIISTCIPIVLMSGIEFTIGLLTEFRLSEYIKQLKR